MSEFIPRMIEVRQSYPASTPLDIPSLIERQLAQAGVAEKIKPGMKIAVGVGSRGIANLQQIVKATLAVLTKAGARPFIVPAMGSHGGATAEGQTKLLAEYGITAESLGVPIEASMEARKIGTTSDGSEVLFSVPALAADFILPINRVKPHTDFPGTLGSGILKMLTIGFGKHAGAINAHRDITRRGYEAVLREFSRIILDTVPVLCGVAIVEDQRHQTAAIEVLRPDEIVAGEGLLLEKARALMPRLPLDEIDLLIIDEIGKEISGAGMDPNVTGRDVSGYSDALYGESSQSPPHLSNFRSQSQRRYQWQRNRHRHGRLHHHPRRQGSRPALHLRQCPHVNQSAVGKDSHSLRYRSRNDSDGTRHSRHPQTQQHCASCASPTR